MRDVRNELSLSGHVIVHIFGWLLAVNLYDLLFLIPLSGVAKSVSEIIFWVGSALVTAAGCFITARTRRNRIALFVDTLLPCTIYAAISFYHYSPKTVLSALGVAVLVAGTVFFLVMNNKIPEEEWDTTEDLAEDDVPDDNADEEIEEESASQRIVRGLHGVRVFFMLTFAALVLIPITVKIYVLKEPVATNTPSDNAPSVSVDAGTGFISDDEYTQMKHYLSEDIWSILSDEEKMEALRLVLADQMSVLGISREITLSLERLGEIRGAYFDPNTYSIVVNKDIFDTYSAKDVVGGLIHEIFHAYQFELMALYAVTPDEYKDLAVFKNVPIYIEESASYTSILENQNKYDAQTIEQDARKYAQNEMWFYVTE